MPDKSLTPTPELAPCPCGGVAAYSKRFRFVRCGSCHVRTGIGSKVGASREWNDYVARTKNENANGPERTCCMCGSINQVRTIARQIPGESIDHDLQCLVCGSKQIKESPALALSYVIDECESMVETISSLRAEITRLRSAESLLHDMAAYKTSLEAEVSRLRGVLEKIREHVFFRLDKKTAGEIFDLVKEALAQAPASPSCSPAKAEALMDLENLLDFIGHKKGEILDLCINPGRLEEVIESVHRLLPAWTDDIAPSGSDHITESDKMIWVNPPGVPEPTMDNRDGKAEA